MPIRKYTEKLDYKDNKLKKKKFKSHWSESTGAKLGSYVII